MTNAGASNDLSRRAEEWMRQRRWAEALQLWTKLVDLRPDSATPLLYKAVCHAHLDQLVEARDAARLALILAPGSPKILRVLEQIQQRLSKAAATEPAPSQRGAAVQSAPEGVSQRAEPRARKILSAVIAASVCLLAIAGGALVLHVSHLRKATENSPAVLSGLDVEDLTQDGVDATQAPARSGVAATAGTAPTAQPDGPSIPMRASTEASIAPSAAPSSSEARPQTPAASEPAIDGEWYVHTETFPLGRACRGARVDGDGKVIVVDVNNGVLRWDPVSRQCSPDDVGLRNGVFKETNEAVGRDGRFKAMVQRGDGKTVILADAKSGSTIGTLTPSKDFGTDIRSVAFSPQSRYLAIGNDKGCTYLCEVPSLRIAWLSLLDGADHPAVLAITFEPGMKRMQTILSTGFVLLWEHRTTPRPRPSIAEIPKDSGATPVAGDFTWSFCPADGGGRVVTAFSHDGRTLVAAAQGAHFAYAYDTATGVQLAKVGPHAGQIVAVALSPERDRIATGSSDGVVKLWDARSGKLLHDLLAHEGAIRTVRFLQGGRRLLSHANGARKNLAIWDPASGKGLLTETAAHFSLSRDETKVAGGTVGFSLFNAVTGQKIRTFKDTPGTLISNELVGIALSPDASTIVAWGLTPLLVDCSTGRSWSSTKEILGRTSASEVFFSLDGRQFFWLERKRLRIVDIPKKAELASVSEWFAPELKDRLQDNRMHDALFLMAERGEAWWLLPEAPYGRDDVGVRLCRWDGSRAVTVMRFEVGRSLVPQSSLSPDLQRLTTIETEGNRRKAVVRAVPSAEVLAVLDGCADYVFTLGAASASSWLATRDGNERLHLWGSPSSPLLRSSPPPFGGGLQALAAGGLSALACCDAAGPFVREPFSAREIIRLPKVPSGTRYAALAPDGRSLVLLDRDSDTLFHELPSGKKTGRARSGGPGAFALGGAELACADKGHVAIIDQVARKALAEKLMPHTGVEAVAVSDDGRRFVSVGKEPSAILWHAVTHREMASMRGHDGPALCGAISPDNGTVVTGGADGTVRTWDPMGGRMVVVGTGHAGRVTCLDFSPDGILLASGSEDRTIVLWEAPTLERPTRLCAFNDPVKAVLFTEDGAALYAFSTAGQARLWDIRGIFAIASQSPSKDSARAPRSEAGSGPEKAAPAAVPVKPKAVEPSVSGAPPGSPPVRAAPGLPTSNEFDRRFWLARAMEGARAVSDREVQPWLWRDVAIEQTHSGDGEGAKETARQHLGEGISKGYSLHTIALAQVEAQDVRGAVATARSIEDVAWRIKTLCAIARAEVASGKPQEARAVLDGLPSLITSDLIPLIDERYGIWFVLALAEAEVGDIHTAEALENNLRKDDLEKVRCAIAASLLLAGDVAAAKTRIDKIPTDSRSLVDFYLAMYRALAGQIDVAEAAAIDKEPKAGEVLAILAERCDRKGDLVNAAALVQKIQGLSQDPKVIDLSLKVMRSLADAGDPARIAAISGRVPERPELQAQALAALALAQVKSGSLGLADETFRKAEATAREVSSYLLRGRAIGAVAAARARTGDFRSLGEWLATIREPLELAYAHLGVSSTMPVPRGPKAEPVAGWPTAAARIQKIQLGPIAMDFVEVPAGTFLRDGKTIHLAKSLLMGRCEVTQDQWTAVMGSNPAQRKNSGSLPVDSVSWQDCQEFCNRIHGPSGRKVRLPSEAEWEYAARAGTTQVYFFGPSERWADLNAHAWWRGNSKGESHPVGQMVPNPWGLCDVLGNVAEWCQDVWHFTFSRAPTDGSAWMDGVSRSETDFHVVRGGSFGDGPEELTIPRRSQTNFGLRSPRLGLRVVIEP